MPGDGAGEVRGHVSHIKDDRSALRRVKDPDGNALPLEGRPDLVADNKVGALLLHHVSNAGGEALLMPGRATQLHDWYIKEGVARKLSYASNLTESGERNPFGYATARGAFKHSKLVTPSPHSGARMSSLYPRLHEYKALFPVGGTDSMVFMADASGTGQASGRARLYYFPISDSPMVERVDYLFYSTGSNGTIPTFTHVVHNNEKKLLFGRIDSGGTDGDDPRADIEIRRPAAIWITDMTKLGTRRVGHMEYTLSSVPGVGSLSSRHVSFDASVQLDERYVYLMGVPLEVKPVVPTALLGTPTPAQTTYTT